MTEAADALYARLKRYEGRAAAERGRGKDPVNAPMIRHWCEALGDTNPAYTGPDAIAPPTMLQAWTMGGLSGHAGRAAAYDDLLGLLDAAGYTSVVATDCEQEYARPLRPGDEITFDAVIEAVSERKTTKLGPGYFVTTRMDVRAGGALAGTHRFRILKYAPRRRGATTEKAAEAAASVPAASPRPATTSRPRSAISRPEPVASRPRPVINRDNAGFWEGVARHRLLIQRCGDCARLRFPWLPGCNACGSPRWDTVEARGDGTVSSYVVMHHPPFPACAVPEGEEGDGGAEGAEGAEGAVGGVGAGPYAVVLVELAEGVRMISQVVGVPHDRVRIGMPVRLEFRRVDEDLELPLFRAVSVDGGVR
ncbi:bifunctional MaoC family dehydratase N-terminal/OB-fold nucleic acid binding domain-containing protein [Streptomyces sp. G45]|uniref:bifunctional MaoC family dehydratase N-terminal/OB-fold nucleic acid binding domain-containing protein n=1 Tax=Streptomyces sp. G45 TaxID=3406627 RepID=UPI003C1E412D